MRWDCSGSLILVVVRGMLVYLLRLALSSQKIIVSLSLEDASTESFSV